MNRAIRVLMACVLTQATCALAQPAKPEPPKPMKLADLPADVWTQLPNGAVNVFTTLVYDPGTQQLVAPLAGGNGTAHLDRETGTWKIALEPTKGNHSGDQPLMKCYQLVNGRPNFSDMLLYSMVAYDTQRKRVVAGATQFMASYDPAAKAWTNLGAKVSLAGKDYPGVPPVAWGSMCYDPVNDEIVQFGGGAVYNWENWEKDKEVTGTFGTWIYSCKNNTWSQPQIGPAEFYKARDLVRPVRIALQDQMSITGEDIVSELNGEKTGANPDGIEKVAAGLKALAKQIADLGKHERLAAGAAKIEQAAAKLVAAGKPRDIYAAQFEALKLVTSAVQEDLWSNPHPRYISQMCYLPGQKAILVFGGHDGWQLLNDTWLYDCTTRTWQKKNPKALPRPRMMHGLVYSDKLASAVMVGACHGSWTEPKDQLNEVWLYDAAADDWKLVLKSFPFERGKGSSYFAGYSPADDAIIVQRNGGETFGLKLTKTTALEAPPATTRPVLEDQRPFDPPADDPAIVERWKNLPANTWVQAKATLAPGAGPSNEYGWGMIGYNTRLGCMIIWGGGHSTHQANDIHLYFPGANKWVCGYPGHAINIPPWNKGCGNPGGVDWRGGVNNLHARRGVGGNGGKALITIQTFSPYFYGPTPYLRTPESWGRTTTFEFDYFSRRWIMPLPTPVANGMNRPYDAKRTTASVAPDGTSWWDTTDKTWKRLSQGKLPANHGYAGEGGAPFVLAEKRKTAVALLGAGKDKPMETWTLDFDGTEWKNTNATGAPPGSPTGSAYCEIDDCIYTSCFTGFEKRTIEGQEGVYSFKRNAWTTMPSKGQAGLPGASSNAWTKVTYDPKHNLVIRFVDGPGMVWVMRPEFDKLDWK